MSRLPFVPFVANVTFVVAAGIFQRPRPCPDGGNQFFGGGNVGTSHSTQKIDLLHVASKIDNQQSALDIELMAQQLVKRPVIGVGHSRFSGIRTTAIWHREKRLGRSECQIAGLTMLLQCSTLLELCLSGTSASAVCGRDRERSQPSC